MRHTLWAASENTGVVHVRLLCVGENNHSLLNAAHTPQAHRHTLLCSRAASETRRRQRTIVLDGLQNNIAA